MSDEVWQRVYEINLRGVWLTTKHAAPHLRRAKTGAIVNASSTGGLTGYPMSPAYCATKGAVIQLTKATAIDLAPDGVRANCYCPGAIDTPMTAKYFEAADDPEAIKAALAGSHLVPRLGTSEEVARLVCFLASDEASFINGAAITIDGGSLAWRGTNG
jgi:NAD(P)-dependent dehydrogenase (short-subunit alcohol dehydrogenase family)